MFYGDEEIVYGTCCHEPEKLKFCHLGTVHTKKIINGTTVYDLVNSIPGNYAVADNVIDEIFNDNEAKVKRIIKDNHPTKHCYYEYASMIYNSIKDELIFPDQKDTYMTILIEYLFMMFHEPHNPDNKLRKLVKNNLVPTNKKLSKEEQQHMIDIMKNDLLSSISTTEKQQEINSRRYHEVLRKMHIKINCSCKICGLKNESFLFVSHSKPWYIANNYERLDFYNTLFLCSGHNTAYDKGLITFSNDGQIIISSLLDEDTANKLGISKDIKIDLLPEHIKYIQYHRENVFRP